MNVWQSKWQLRLYTSRRPRCNAIKKTAKVLAEHLLTQSSDLKRSKRGWTTKVEWKGDYGSVLVSIMKVDEERESRRGEQQMTERGLKNNSNRNGKIGQSEVFYSDNRGVFICRIRSCIPASLNNSPAAPSDHIQAPICLNSSQNNQYLFHRPTSKHTKPLLSVPLVDQVCVWRFHVPSQWMVWATELDRKWMDFSSQYYCLHPGAKLASLFLCELAPFFSVSWTAPPAKRTVQHSSSTLLLSCTRQGNLMTSTLKYCPWKLAPPLPCPSPLVPVINTFSFNVG